MNCKQGDLAIITAPGLNSGRIVRCLAPLGRFLTNTSRGAHIDFWWRIDISLPSFDGTDWSRECNDSVLRPIRDNPGADETLTWAGKPEKVLA